MLANWVKEVTATVGTGAITLGGAPAGYVPFSEAFADTDNVLYTIEDGVNREIGIGTLAAGSPWSLIRTYVMETLVGGVLTKSGAAPINLSGAAIISIDASVATSRPPLIRQPVAAAYVKDAYATKTSVNSTLVANRLYLLPFTLEYDLPVDAMYLRQIVTASGSGTAGKMGIYKPNEFGAPRSLLAEITGSLNMATTGYNVLASLGQAVFLRRGLYYLGLLTDGNAVVGGLDANSYVNPMMQSVPSTTLSIVGVQYQSDVSAGWAGMPPVVTGPAGNADYAKQPTMYLRVAS